MQQKGARTDFKACRVYRYLNIMNVSKHMVSNTIPYAKRGAKYGCGDVVFIDAVIFGAVQLQCQHHCDR